MLQTTLGLCGTLLLTAGVAVLGFAFTLVLPEPGGRSLGEIAVHIPAPAIGHPLTAEKARVP